MNWPNKKWKQKLPGVFHNWEKTCICKNLKCIVKDGHVGMDEFSKSEGNIVMLKISLYG